MQPLRPASFLVLAASAWLFGAANASAQDTIGKLGSPVRKLMPADVERFARGRALFDTPMHRSRGLGAPELNADSCRGCHQDPALGGAGGSS